MRKLDFSFRFLLDLDFENSEAKIMIKEGFVFGERVTRNISNLLLTEKKKKKTYIQLASSGYICRKKTINEI